MAIVVPAHKETNFRLLLEAATRRGITLKAFSGNWIKHLELGDKTAIVFGYKWPLNDASASLTCGDKAAASDIMKMKGIPHIRHRLFLTPSPGEWVPKEGTWEPVHAYASKHRYDVVSKPKDGTGGEGISHTIEKKDLEAAVSALFAKKTDVVISAFKKISAEYRVIVLGGHVEVIFKKEPPFVTGDGEKTVTLLVSEFLSGLDPKRAATVAKNMASTLFYDQRKPAKEEKVYLHWKHNLGQGASCELLGGESCPEVPERKSDGSLLGALTCLALKTAKVFNMGFCSVDIVTVEGEVKAGKALRVMEVNAGVMMDNLVQQQGALGEAIASRVMDKALALLFPA